MSGTCNSCLINVISVQFQGSKDSCWSEIPKVSCFVPSFFTATVAEHWSVSRTTCCFNLPTWKYWSTQLTVASIFMNLPIIEEIWPLGFWYTTLVMYLCPPAVANRKQIYENRKSRRNRNPASYLQLKKNKYISEENTYTHTHTH